MKLARAAVCCLAVLFAAIASAQTCPQFSPPFGSIFVANSLAQGCGAVSPCAPGTLTFSFTPASGTGGIESCDTVTWSFGDGSPSVTTGSAPLTHAYPTFGTYPVSATVLNSKGSYTANLSLAVAAGTIGLNPAYYTFGLTVSENVGSVPVTFVRSNINGTATVNYATADGSAHAGTEYTATSGSITFNPGESTKTINIPIIDNNVFTGLAPWFTFTVSSPSTGWLLTNLTSYPSTLTEQISIQDNETPPTFAFAQNSYTVSETAGSATIAVNRTGDMTQTASVRWTVQYPTPIYDTLTFAPNEASKTFSVPVTNDTVYTGNRSYLLDLYPLGISRVSNPSGNLTIVDDETQPELVADDVSIAEGDNGQTKVTFTIRLNGSAVQGSVNVYASTVSGTAKYLTDYVSDPAQSGYLSFAPGEMTKTFSAFVIGNTKPEPNKTFSLQVYSAYTSNGIAIKLTKPIGVCTIVNDDHAAIPYSQQVAVGQVGAINLALGQGPAVSDTIAVVSNAPNVVSVPATATVGAGQANISIPVSAKAVGGALITMTLPASLGGGTVQAAISVYSGAGVNFSPSFLSLPVGTTTTVTASIDPAQTAPITINLSTLDSTVVSVSPNVTVPAGGSATFTVKGLKRGGTSILANSSLAPQAMTLPVDVTDPFSGLTITSIVPPSAPASGGTAVTINGANITAPCTVTFGGVAANVGTTTSTFIAVTTPPHTPGYVDVSVSCAGTTATLTNGFAYSGAGPSVSSVEPSFGSTSGGTVVRINGDGFGSRCWPFFGASGGRSASVISSKEIVVTTPPHAAAESVDVSVRCAASQQGTLANAFAYGANADGAPVVSSVAPLAAAPGDSITISGIRFRNTDRVTFDNAPATVLSTAPDTHVVTVPELPLGTVSINVTDSSGHVSTTGPIFTVLEPAPPHVTSVAPSRVAPGGELTITGSGFRPSYSFSLGGMKLTTMLMTPSRAVAFVPVATPAGTVPLNVKDGAGQTAAIGDNVTVDASAPAIGSVAPACASSDGNVAIHIAGSGFASGATVTVGGAAATQVSVLNANAITATVPAGTVGTAVITVTNPNGSSAVYGNGFRYSSPYDPEGCAPRSHAATH